jgi:hypothetical protein
MTEATVTTKSLSGDELDKMTSGESNTPNELNPDKVASHKATNDVGEQGNDPEGHRQAMIDKADKGLDTNTNQTDELFAGKYKSEEEYNKAIIHAFKKKHGDNHEDAFKQLTGDLSDSDNASNESQTDSGEADGAGDSTVADDTGDAQTDSTDDLSNDSEGTADPINMDDFIKEFDSEGGISTDSYGKLEKAGYDRGMVDTYMSGIEAQRDSLFAICGGKDEFFQMTEWAADDGGMSKADIDSFNENLNSGNMTKMKQAVTNLKLTFDAAGKRTAPGTKVEATHTDTSGVTGYTHIDQLKLDQANPLYQKSEAFRAEVKEKIRRGSI